MGQVSFTQLSRCGASLEKPEEKPEEKPDRHLTAGSRIQTVS